MINLEDSARNVVIDPNEKQMFLLCQNKLAASFINETDNEVTAEYQIRILSQAANELSKIASTSCYRDYFIEGFKEVRKHNVGKCKIELYDVISVNDTDFAYENQDILSEDN